MMQGWIKVHRAVMDNQIIMKSPDHLAVWMYLLLHATHKEQPATFKGKELILKPGQLITGRKMIADKLNISESKVHRVLTLFETEHMIEQQTSNKNRLIYLPDWNKQQSTEQPVEQQEQQVNGKLNNKAANIERQDEQRKNSLKSTDNRNSGDCEYSQVNNKLNNKTGKNERQIEHKQEYSKNVKQENKNAGPEQIPDPSGILLPLVDKTVYDIPLSHIEQWRMAFPAVNVEQELQRMIAWLNANSSRRKSRRGIEHFIVSWLTRSQDNVGAHRQHADGSSHVGTGFTNFEQRDYDFDLLEQQLLDAQE